MFWKKTFLFLLNSKNNHLLNLNAIKIVLYIKMIIAEYITNFSRAKQSKGTNKYVQNWLVKCMKMGKEFIKKINFLVNLRIHCFKT